MVEPKQPWNAEKEMPSWEIPKEWTSAEALGECILYGGSYSPPTLKVKAILMKYGVAHKLAMNKKKGSAYSKVPVLDIGDKQINDSYVISRVLAPILTGVELTDAEVEFEDMTTYGLMLAMEVSVMDDAADLRKCAVQMGGCMGCFLACIACIVPLSIKPSSGIKEMYPSLGSVGMYGAKFAALLDTSKFFHGDTCGVVDCSLYGALEPFRTSRCKCYDEFMATSPMLGMWHSRVKECIPGPLI